ncbi:MAG TPA: ribonuclease R [Clostridiales bacterium]|nr:ribonuclease R [Clostridiales bacterium]
MKEHEELKEHEGLKESEELKEHEGLKESEVLKEKEEMLEELFSSKEYKPLKFKDLVVLLQVPRGAKHELKLVLDQLISKGSVILDAQGRYRLPGDDIKVGTFSGTQRGFGFVVLEGEEEDIFIPGEATKGALHGDRVMVSVKEEQTGRRKEGAIVGILERGKNEIVGTFEKNKNFGFVIPDNQKFGKDIFIPKEHTKGAVNGHKVVVKLTDYGDEAHSPEGKVIEILGHVNDPGVDIMSVIKAYELPVDFPEEVMRSLYKVPEEIDPTEIENRMDIRDMMTVTIDGEDAKDLDDAITLTKEGDIYHLGVHIADVSHYVKEGSALDKEALKRGTSVYLVDRVIPMLPHKLSNGICSLNPEVDRLSLSCFMDIDGKGTVLSHRIAETVMRSDRRMTYTNVAKIVEEQDEEVCKEYEELVPMFMLMQELAEILKGRRHKRGAINFDFPESKIIVDKQGKPIEIKPYERNKATKIIEEFMLIANETVAEDFFWQELPFVYRTHDNPDEDKIRKLAVFINNFGYSMKIGQEEIHPKEIQKLLVKVEDTPEEALISRLTLRSMKQAKYTVVNTGHFGLSAKYYCHFTSPIRRYPDLQIHRIIKENLNGRLGEQRIHHYEKILFPVSDHSSKTERRADEAEREVQKLKKVEYMMDHIDEIFEGVISGVTSWGMYVELPNTVEGMIRVSEMNDDYYIYDEERYQMVGEHTKKTYKLGQKVMVQVVNADKIMRTIDFALVEEEPYEETGDKPHETMKEEPHETMEEEPHKTMGVKPHKTVGVKPHKTMGVKSHKTVRVKPHKTKEEKPHKNRGKASYKKES